MFKIKIIKKTKETVLADLEIFHSVKMTADAGINGSQARSYPVH